MAIYKLNYMRSMKALQNHLDDLKVQKSKAKQQLVEVQQRRKELEKELENVREGKQQQNPAGVDNSKVEEYNKELMRLLQQENNFLSKVKKITKRDTRIQKCKVKLSQIYWEDFLKFEENAQCESIERYVLYDGE